MTEVILNREKNKSAKSFIVKFTNSVLNSNDVFVRVYGKNFAKSSLAKTLKNVYTEEIDINEPSVAGYYTLEDKSITICSPLEKMNTKNFSDKNKLQLLLHEAIHAVLVRSPENSKEKNLPDGTGMMSFKNGLRKNVEVGRGINEGYTEWLCEKVGYPSTSYAELKQFVKLIELAIGEENTMSLGKGLLSKYMKMNKNTIVQLFSWADAIYESDRELIDFKEMINLLDRHNSKENEQIDYNEYTKKIDRYKSDDGYKEWLKQKEKEPCAKELANYFRTKKVREMEENINISKIYFGSMIIDNYFSKEFEEMISKQENKQPDYKRYSTLYKLLSIDTSYIPEFFLNKEGKLPSAIIFAQGYEKMIDNYIKNYGEQVAKKYKDGQLTLKEFVKYYNNDVYNIAFGNKSLSRKGVFNKQDFFINSFCDCFDSNDSANLQKILKTAISYGIKYNEKIDILPKSKIYYLKPKAEESRNTIELIYGDNGIVNYPYNDIIYNDKLDKSNLVNELIQNETEDSTQILEQFDIIKNSQLKEDPNSSIHISNSNIVIQNKNGTHFFHVFGNKIIQMEVAEEKEFNFAIAKDNIEETKLRTLNELLAFSTKRKAMSKINNFTNSINNRLNKLFAFIKGKGKQNEIASPVLYKVIEKDSLREKYKVDEPDINRVQNAKAIDRDEEERDI